MNTAMTVGLTLAIGAVGMGMAPSVSARPFFGGYPDDPARLAQKEAILRHNAEKQAILGGWAREVTPPPPPPRDRPILGGPHGGARHHCAVVERRVWVPGRYERVVEYRPGEGEGRGGWHGGFHGGGASCGEPVIVMRWIPGYYETVYVQDPACECHGPVCGIGPRRGEPWPPPRHW